MQKSHSNTASSPVVVLFYIRSRDDDGLFAEHTHKTHYIYTYMCKIVVEFLCDGHLRVFFRFFFGHRRQSPTCSFSSWSAVPEAPSDRPPGGMRRCMIALTVCGTRLSLL